MREENGGGSEESQAIFHRANVTVAVARAQPYQLVQHDGVSITTAPHRTLSLWQIRGFRCCLTWASLRLQLASTELQTPKINVSLQEINVRRPDVNRRQQKIWLSVSNYTLRSCFKDGKYSVTSA